MTTIERLKKIRQPGLYIDGDIIKGLCFTASDQFTITVSDILYLPNLETEISLYFPLIELPSDSYNEELLEERINDLNNINNKIDKLKYVLNYLKKGNYYLIVNQKTLNFNKDV